MSRTLFLHVGPPKTGTTAVQDVLRAHDNSVLIYPKVGLWPDGSHHNLVFNFFHDYSRAETIREDIDALFGRIAAEAGRSQGNVLISSEILSGRERVPDFVRALLSRLGPEFHAVVLFVVRDHFERAASVYNQRVKDAVTGEKRGPDSFLVRQARQLCYAQSLHKFQRPDFELKVINYHPAHDFVSRFLKCVGFVEKQIPEIPKRNVSLSTKALISVLAANRIAASVDERNRYFAALRTMPGCFAPSQFIFSSHACAEAEREFSADREFLLDAFGIDLSAAFARGRTEVFHVSELEYGEVATATSDLGAEGAEIRNRVREYLRPAEGTRSISETPPK